MANALYDYGREGFLAADIDWDADNIHCHMVDDASYTVNLATHQFLSDVAVGARVATSANFTTKTTTAGVSDADDVTLISVTGADCERIVINQNTGVDASSRLIASIDTATGLPVTPNGGDIVITWDSGANKIFKL